MKKMTTKEFIDKSTKIHNNKYNYSKVDYKNQATKVCIVCPVHGGFWQTPGKHLNGQGCPKCFKEKSLTLDIFLKEAKEIHGDKYDYSKVEYVNQKTKVCIICPEHGEFWQTPSNHLQGKGCSKCAKRFMNTPYFIEKSKITHGDKYDYSKVEYVKYSEPVCIICPEHGEFWQNPYIHMNGCGCPKCGGTYKFTTKEFIEKARKVHGDKYDYSKVEYVNQTAKVCIICPEHGEFWQTPREHLGGCGCQVCGLIKRSSSRVKKLEDYVQMAKIVHNNFYNYEKVKYKNLKEKIVITCPKHGDFKQEAFSHLNGCGCPKCSVFTSKNEKEIFEYLKKEMPQNNVEQHNRDIIKPYEIDIFLPTQHIGVEYNGLVWHSEMFQKGMTYHINKTIKSLENNVKLIQIFEDEYIEHKELVLNKIKHILQCDKTKNKIYARKCIVKRIPKENAKAFLNKFHIQGYGNCTISFGAYFNDELVGVMTFKKEHREGYWELTRFATDYHYVCCGVGGKLFKYFLNEHNPIEVKSFADRRWTTDSENNLYKKLGFNFQCYTKPDYTYFNPKMGIKRYHKFNFRKQTLHKKYGLPLTMTESEMTAQLGYYKIWNCGLIKYVWSK